MLGNNQNSSSSVFTGITGDEKERDRQFVASFDEEQLYQLPIDKIIPNPLQPRRLYDEESVETLAENIKRVGLIQPIIVRRRNDKFIIVAGEMRWRAFQKLGRKIIKAVIHAEDGATSDEMAFSENMIRTNLSLLDEINAIDDHSKCGKSEAEMAKITGRSVRHIQRAKRVFAFFYELQSRIGVDYMMLDEVCKRHGLRSLEQAAKMAEAIGEYYPAWELLKNNDSFAAIKEAAEIAVIEAQERKAAAAEPAPADTATDSAEVAKTVETAEATDDLALASDDTGVNSKDVKGSSFTGFDEEGDSGEITTKHTQNRVVPEGEALETAPSAPKRPSSAPAESNGEKKVSDMAILRALGKLKDAMDGLEALGITNGAVIKVREDKRDQIAEAVKRVEQKLPVVESSITSLKLSIVKSG